MLESPPVLLLCVGLSAAFCCLPAGCEMQKAARQPEGGRCASSRGRPTLTFCRMLAAASPAGSPFYWDTVCSRKSRKKFSWFQLGDGAEVSDLLPIIFGFLSGSLYTPQPSDQDQTLQQPWGVEEEEEAKKKRRRGFIPSAILQV
ncbi:hypothetical protein GOODEAATRI_017458 [Goodea atripinnis]|uniref:Uncharacterized protein n=1 Tax=Goodea atripinnis TaxID=208336 RepID=A0ABV0MSW7_9TELE